jgi:very-short-patch-repair endonuclease
MRVEDPADRERALAATAGAQMGVVSHRQLRGLGLSQGAIAHRVAVGRLHRIHRGVYLAGHMAAVTGATEMAAVLACGNAVLSHETVARLWEIRPPAAGEAAIDVTVPSRRRQRAGLRVHLARLLSPDIRQRHGLPLTSPARTALDLAAGLPIPELARACEEARVQRLVSSHDLEQVCERCRGHRGASRLAEYLRREAEPALTRSAAERRMFELVRAARLPAPEVNVRIHGYQVDFLWRAQRLVLEIDGYRFHSTRAAFERGRAKGAKLAAAGLSVMRATWRQLQDES